MMTTSPLNPLNVPAGFCQCGCGLKTRVASKNDLSTNRVKGRPMRFVRGHHSRPNKPRIIQRPNIGIWINARWSPCHLWNWLRDFEGYGITYLGDKNVRAHRVAWQKKHGPIPAGKQLCHRCDQRACVNDDHLFLCTQAQNVADMDAKGRRATGAAWRKGKLSEAQARRILTLRKQSKTWAQISRAIGASRLSVKRVLTCKSWRHINPVCSGARVD